MNSKEGHSKESHSTRSEPLSRRRLWLFRLGASILIPLTLFGGIELALRSLGYGYPTSFFVPARIDGRDYFVTNDKFGFRFFPPALARTPSPLRMSAVKPTNSYRIFLFGESAAQGDPDPTFGFGRYLEVLLGERYPGTEFEVVCGAMTAINSHAVLPIARECARHDGDLWVVYMGNNEMVGPFGAGTVFGPRAPGLGFIRANLALKSTKLGQFMYTLTERLGGNASAPRAWGGLKMFEKHQLRSEDPSRLQAYVNFRENLERVLRAGEKAGIPILLSTMASNLKDCAPFASLHRVTLAEEQKSVWDRAFKEGIALEAAGKPREALAAYSAAAAIDSEYAELQFRIGTCQLALTNGDQARRSFELARDDDALAFRADTRINQIIREAADRHQKNGVYLVDAVNALTRNSPSGIPGQELFYEHVHLNFEGNYRLARAFAGQIATLLPAAIRSRNTGDWASAESCSQRLAVSPWDTYRVWQANFSRVSEPPFTDQLNDVPRAKMYMAKLEELRSRMGFEAQTEARAMYRNAVARAPTDPALHGNYAQFLGEIGDFAQAVEEEKRVCEWLPPFPGPFHRLGLLLVRQGKTTPAAECFSRALVLRDDYVPALNELGLILANQQRTAEAAACFAKAARINPGYTETYLNQGFLEQSLGKLAPAIARYQEAASLQPNGPAAHFSQAVDLAAQHRRSEAISFFRAAVWMNPGFWQAHYLLGVELAADGKVEEAQAQFSEVTRQRPDFAKAHLNLGVALAKQKKLEEAATEFRAVLQINPTNELALQHLETIQALKNRGP